MAYDSENDLSICMEGGKQLEGKVHIQGSKNAALPVLAASILIPEVCGLKNVPNITDINCMENLLESTGAVLEKNEEAQTLRIEATNINEYRLPAKYVSAMRSSVVLMGALLGRVGEALVDYPGGCVIGERPIDLHLYGLEKLGAQIWTDKNRIHAYADELKGTQISFPFPSVGATQNTILAAVTARGTTVIKNAAREPEITALCDFLNQAGADIEIGSDFIATGKIVIHGVEVSRLHGVEYKIIPDRIVAGTYLFAVLAAGGSVELENAPAEQLGSVCDLIERMGGNILSEREGKKEKILVRVDKQKTVRNVPFVETDVYPAFPTDLQSPLLACACVSKGEMVLKERIFSSRFKVVEELVKMGADIIEVDNESVRVRGVEKLAGRTVIARELRGGAALVIAGLAASGITTVKDIRYINRGYQDIVGDLKGLGARINYVDS
ncbi:MAG: UDP-N-acetylglucosamine 1-carboxyvinyltransferase [Lachnospiraceae bacterium]|nr:UDP-N-acetylglucosamine 1-carboxyvinyltransferase [Lachnospiraceae bacterium]